MSTILITGCDGIVGSILQKGLQDKYVIRGIDLPEDISDYDALRRHMDGVDVVIHLAHRSHLASETIEQRMRIRPENVSMDVNIFMAVVESGVRRLILASSVHADNHRNPAAAIPFTIPGSYYPATPYGSYKLVVEEVGKVLSRRFGFEFIGVRLGGVTRDNSVKTGEGQTATWLSHNDLLRAFDACLTSEWAPKRSTVFYAVSNNSDRIHDIANPFDWEPRDDSADQT